MSPPFQAGSWDHLAALAAILGTSGLAAVLGRRFPGARPWLRGFAALFLASYFAAVLVLRGHRTGFDWRDSLPLHLCDLVVLFAIDALIRESRLSCEITYYWTLAGTLQALLTPDLYEGFPSLSYLLFFLGHGGNILAVAVLLSSTGYRPTRRGLLYAFLGLVLYVPVVGTLDWAFGWNYGYLCRPPSRASLADYLGPWPYYIFSGLMVGLLMFGLLYLPWMRREDSPASREKASSRRAGRVSL